MEKSEVNKKVIFSLRWSVDIKFYIFTSKNIKYTLYFINIFLYFTTMYIIKKKIRVVETRFRLKCLISIAAFPPQQHSASEIYKFESVNESKSESE